MKVEMGDVFTPLIIPLLACVAWAFLMAYIFGKVERQRIGIATIVADQGGKEDGKALGWRFYFNWVLTIALMAALVGELLPISYLFMIASAIALVVNFPKYKD